MINLDKYNKQQLERLLHDIQGRILSINENEYEEEKRNRLYPNEQVYCKKCGYNYIRSKKIQHERTHKRDWHAVDD